MKRQRFDRVRRIKPERGFTLLELIIASAILVVLSTMAVPLARLTIQREKERMLRFDLWEMRDAIDRYKDAADRGGFQTKVDSQNYPPDLETLVKGVDVQGKKIRFLRKIPIDPMTGNTEWGLRSMQDDPESDSWGGQSVFDVFNQIARHGAGRNEVQGLVMARRPGTRRSAGFTLLEMMIVMIVIGILMSIALPIYTTSLLKSREAVLRQDLFTLRSLISQYTSTSKKRRSPRDLIQGGYLKIIPKDPMTNEPNWEVVQEEILLTVDQQDPGISDVHSASSATATDGTAYSSW